MYQVSSKVEDGRAENQADRGISSPAWLFAKLLAGPVAIGQGVMVLNQKRVDLDKI